MNPISSQQASFDFPTESGPSRIVLEIRGSIPPFKNSRLIVSKGRNGSPLPRPFLITKPEYAKRMEEITESLRLQLLSAFQTGAGRMPMGCSLRSWIALSAPLDDAWTFLPKITITAELCAPGEEGATLTIERL